MADRELIGIFRVWRVLKNKRQTSEYDYTLSLPVEEGQDYLESHKRFSKVLSEQADIYRQGTYAGQVNVVRKRDDG